MSLLSERVQESKVYKWNFIPGTISVAYGTVSPYSGNHYQTFLMKIRESSQFGNEQVGHDTIVTECHCDTGNGKVTGCKGNSYHTICKHCLGLIRFYLGLKDCKIAFCENIFKAIKLRKPGESLAQVRSAQGRGLLWGVVGDAKDKCITCGRVLKNRDANCLDCSKCANIRVGKMLDLEERAILLHGPEDEQNGID